MSATQYKATDAQLVDINKDKKFVCQQFLAATVLSGMGFKQTIESVTVVRKGHATGIRQHVFRMPRTIEVPYHDGTSRRFNAAGIHIGLKYESSHGRWCAMDDACPEHTALWLASVIVNRRAILRHCKDNLNLKRWTWKHTERVHLINSANETPASILQAEMGVTPGEHIKQIQDYNTRGSFDTGSNISKVDGASGKVATDNLSIGLTLATIGFPFQTLIRDKQIVFIFEPQAEVITNVHFESTPSPMFRRLMTAKEIIHGLEAPSQTGKWRLLEDLYPEHSALHVVGGLCNFYHMLDMIRRPPEHPRLRIERDGTQSIAFVKENHTVAFDNLAKLFKRKTGKYKNAIPLL